VAPTATVLEGGVRQDRALGSETGRRTDHVPLRTLSQEAVILPASRAPFLFSFSSPLPLFFIPSVRHATPPTAALRHPPFHLFHPPPRCPHRRRRRPQRARRQKCPTAAAFDTPSLCSITPHVFPSPLLPSSRRVSALPRCQRHQYPPHRRCLTMRTKDIKPLEN
jgi:hypothetical protein